MKYANYLDKVYGCFLGKTIAGTMGAPFEGVKMPMELTFCPEMVDSMIPNDDLDLQVLWLDVVEKHGKDFTSYDLLKRFCEYSDYNMGEYAVMRKNFNRGIYPPLSGKFCNDFYVNGMGCPIRSEIWACLAPNNPVQAVEYASRDGVLDHYGESVYAECFLAALESLAFSENDINKLIEDALQYVPADSRFYQLVIDTREYCQRYDDIKTILRKILFKYGHNDCTNMFQNMGIVIAALLQNNLDLIKASMDALNCGFDTDCTCATIGAVIGTIIGAKAMIAEYGLKDVRYVLGVKSDRRSDSVRDLSEDIALLGAVLCDNIEEAPHKDFLFEPSLYPIKFWVEYANDNPTFRPGSPCIYTLNGVNLSGSTINTTCKVYGINTEEEFNVLLESGATFTKSLIAEFPEDADKISETNMFTVNYTYGKETKTYTYGVVGALPWKVFGPIWRTDPICTTELLEKNNREYMKILKDVPYDGHAEDVRRRFHLNFCADVDTDYLRFEECYGPVNEEGNYEESVFWQSKDSFRIDDFCEFKGPAVYYLSRELVSKNEDTVYIQVGHSAPFVLWINGEKIAERKNCDTWTAENVHLKDIHLKAGVNRILLRLTRVNEDAKYNLCFSRDISMGENIVDFSVNLLKQVK